MNNNLKKASFEIIKERFKSINNLFSDEDITEIAFNGENKLFIEKKGDWIELASPKDITLNTFASVAVIVANDLETKFDDEHPVLSGSLITGERIQITRPPASKNWSLTIRKYSENDFTLEQLKKFGMFNFTKVDYRINESFFSDTLVDDKTKKIEEDIRHCLEQRDFIKFFQLAIIAKKNIIVSGATGSGKTTFTKALIHKIPTEERLITIEDAEEIRFEKHENFVQLFFDRNAKVGEQRTAQNMLLSCMRMKPDRVLVSEIRGGEALTFLESVVSGHPGSITTLHANSVTQAKEKMIMMIMQANSSIPISFLDKLITENINIFVQINKVKNRRDVTGILYQ